MSRALSKTPRLDHMLAEERARRRNTKGDLEGGEGPGVMLVVLFFSASKKVFLHLKNIFPIIIVYIGVACPTGGGATLACTVTPWAVLAHADVRRHGPVIGCPAQQCTT